MVSARENCTTVRLPSSSSSLQAYRVMRVKARFPRTANAKGLNFMLRLMSSTIDCSECWRDSPRFGLDAIVQNCIPVTSITLYSYLLWYDSKRFATVQFVCTMFWTSGLNLEMPVWKRQILYECLDHHQIHVTRGYPVSFLAIHFIFSSIQFDIWSNLLHQASTRLDAKQRHQSTWVIKDMAF